MVPRYNPQYNVKNLTGEIKKSRIAMGPDTRKWHQTDREGISYHYHSKLGEVTAVTWRRVSKRKSGVYTYLHQYK